MNAAQRRKAWRRAKRLKGRPIVVRFVRWWGDQWGVRWLPGKVMHCSVLDGRIEMEVYLGKNNLVTVRGDRVREA